MPVGPPHSRGEFGDWDDIRDGTDQGAITGPPDYSAFSSTLLKRLDAWKAEAVAQDTREFGMVADDLSIIVVGTIESLLPVARSALAIVTRWSEEYEVQVSDKTCALLIAPQGNNQVEWRYAALKCGPISFVPRRQGAIRILGHLIDARLTMNDAVADVVQKVEISLQHLLPILLTTSLVERKAIFTALAYSHVRRIAPLLLALVPDNSQHWASLDSAVAAGCRVITGTTATANTVAVLFEAGFTTTFALAVAESHRLRAKWGATTGIADSLKNHALRLLGRHTLVGDSPTQCVGVVVDHTLCRPHEAPLAESVGFRSKPIFHGDEARSLRNLDPDIPDDAEAILAIKKKANARMKRIVDNLAINSCAVFCDGSVLRPSAHLPHAGGAGAAALFINGHLDSHTFIHAGGEACSFTAEALGFLAALRLIRRSLEEGDVPRSSTIPIVSDSQGVLRALEKGPLRQTDSRLDFVWRELMNLRAEFEVAFGLIFAFGHTGWPEADKADELAGVAAKSGRESRDAPWWKDAARVSSSAPISEICEVAVADTLRRKLSRAARVVPSLWSSKKYKGFSQRELTLLCQLRTNACSQLGGHLVGHRTNCTHCGTAVARGNPLLQSMVEHSFVCPSFRGARRIFRVTGVRDLWRRPRNSLDSLFYAFFDVGRERSPDVPPPFVR